MRPILGTLGASLTISGRLVSSFTILVTAAAAGPFAAKGFAKITLHIWAGDVYFDEIGLGLGDDAGYRTELRDRAGKDAGDDGNALWLQPRPWPLAIAPPPPLRQGSPVQSH